MRTLQIYAGANRKNLNSGLTFSVKNNSKNKTKSIRSPYS